MNRFFALLLAILTLGFMANAHAAAWPYETTATHAILLDVATGTVLFEKDADAQIPTASMSKIMTAYMVFDTIKRGELKLDDSFTVSEHAWRTGGAITDGSTSFLPIHSSVKVEDLIRGMVIQSGNDAAITLAEGIAGSEGAFAELMTRKAHELGMKDSSFMNATGLPDPQHYSTVRDLALLADRLIHDFPEFYHYDSEKEFTYNGHTQGNRNPLLYKNLGVDGLKTGHTKEAGYGLVVSGIRNGRRLIMVMTGMKTMKERAEESEKLLEWGFRNFGSYALFKKGEPVGDVPVWLGVAPTVKAIAGEDVAMVLERMDRRGLKVTMTADSPIAAPIQAGQEIGKITIEAPNTPTRIIPVLAAEPVAELGFPKRVFTALNVLLFGET